MSFNTPTFTPPVLAVGQSNSSNGRQQLGSGLVTHRGIIESNSFRATGFLYPQTGTGLEMLYFQTNKLGVVQAYDRDAAAWTDLTLAGKNINLQISGGKVTLPVGTATSQLGLYRQVGAWYVPAAGSWYESNAQVSATTSGGRIRASASGSLFSSAVGTTVYAGFMTDAGLTYDSLTATMIPVAGYAVPFAFTCYSQPAAGLHRFAIALYANVANNSGFWSGVYTNLWIHEELA